MTSSSSLSSGTWKYDVFLSFRGEDTRKTFVDHLYSALEQHRIRTYKDDVTLPRGDSISPSLMNAIQESQIAVVIFSENYADSSWCLEELEHIMKCRHERGQIVLPVFYNVDPSDVRKQKRKYEEAFSKHGLSEKNYQRVESWRKALMDASSIAGWETKHIANGHEAVGIKIMVGTVLEKLLSVKSNVEEDLVGMGPRLQYLESQLQIGSHGVRMIGIWGIGGGGKTTLAYSVYVKIRDYFQGHCFIGNIREESAKHGLQKQQEKVLSEVLKTEVLVASVLEGRDKIQSMLCRRKVLIVLDDVDDREQLEELAGSRDWFGGGSRIIITTRDENLLRTHRVDGVCPVTLLSDDEAIRLFKRYAYKEDNPVEDYDKLSFRVISYVNGLPLALKVLGSFFYNKDKSEWMSALNKLREIPSRKVTDQLKISYDGLDRDEKHIFLDIACFFRRCQKENAMSILKTFGFHANIGMKVLKEKALITISSDGLLDMHDLVQEMGHDIVRGEHPNNPEKHSRVWRSQDIEDICSTNATTENNKIDAIRYVKLGLSPSKSFTTLVSNLKILRFLDVRTWAIYDEGPTFISSELKYMSWYGYSASPLPESFQPRKLVVLNLRNTLQIELWKGDKHLPCLKELNLTDARHLVKTPNFAGLPCLQKLTLLRCDRLEEIHQSLGHHASLVYLSVCSCKNLTRFPSIFRMEKLEVLYISDCEALLEFPKIEANMDSLVNLHLENVGIEVLPSSVGRYCTNLFFPNLKRCSKLKRIEGNFRMEKLEVLYISDCEALLEFPKIEANMDSLVNLHLENVGIEVLPSSVGRYCTNLFFLNLKRCSKLKRIEGIFRMEKLDVLYISDCEALLEFPKIEANMDSLVDLHLENVGIEVLPSSVGRYCTNLFFLNLKRCSKLKRIEGNFRMEKLKVLYISDCEALLEFPKIEANMDSLVDLHLENVGIEVLPSSVGRYCTNLIFLFLKRCSKLKRIEGNFHALKHLHVADVNDHMVIHFPNFHFRKLEWLRYDSCLDLEYWPSNHLPPSPHSPRFLRKLNLNGCRIKDGIPCGIDELLNLQELRLCANHFSRLDSLFQLTRLKLLYLNNCINLVELPELPSNLSILQARDCDSLKAIRDDVHRNCKWLCQVSITSTDSGFCGLVGGERLLETILQGKALCMSIELKGLVIPKGFKLCLVKGRRCRLKLPKNWFNEFSGFLFCFSKKYSKYGPAKITIRQEEKLQMGMRDSYDEQVFCEEESDHIHTWMGYVSFGSLSCTAWWDITTTAVDVSVDLCSSHHNSLITGFGVGLVSKKNQMEETTTNNSCADDDYKCKFEILHDSESLLECQFGTIW